MTQKEFTSEAIEEIIGYISTYAKKEDYGHFLTSFFETFQRADMFNRKILKEAAIQLINKYDLDTHAKEYKDGLR